MVTRRWCVYGHTCVSQYTLPKTVFVHNRLSIYLKLYLPYYKAANRGSCKFQYGIVVCVSGSVFVSWYRYRYSINESFLSVWRIRIRLDLEFFPASRIKPSDVSDTAESIFSVDSSVAEPVHFCRFFFFTGSGSSSYSYKKGFQPLKFC